MGQIYNIYCDESCHLENDKEKAMVLGGVWCPLEKVPDILKRLREIKQQYGLKKEFELKWTKASPAMLRYYINVVDFFFDDDDLHFRCLVVPDKKILSHKDFNQSHNGWYYKMYFDMLKTIIVPTENYFVYIDIKDTRGGDKIRELYKVLSNNMYDFNRDVIKNVQIVRSHEVELIQLADLLIGAVSHLNRDLTTSEAKQVIIKKIQERSGFSLKRSTRYRENKFNVLIWDATKKIC